MNVALEPENLEEIELIDSAKVILDRIKLSVDSASALGNLSSWLCDYTKLDEDLFWSFDDHEMQIDIANDTASRQVIQKCSQVGATQVAVRKALGITSISKSKNIIYGGPSRTWSSKFSAYELHPIINKSPILASALNPRAKGSELIGIGSSFLHLAGTQGAANGAISVPAEYVFIDELDFCNLEVVGKFESRLKHAKEDEYGRKGNVYKWSTPTVEDFGINAEFKKSDQKYYNVHCSGCDEWFEPDYFRDIVIPGWTGTLGPEGKPRKIIQLTPEEVDSGELRIQDAYMACPCCAKDVTKDLCDPKRRKWVARNPSSTISGRQIHPWDVAKVNSIPSILMSMPGYTTTADYYNFAIGIPFTDKNNSFLLGPFDNDDKAPWLNRVTDNTYGSFCMGVDVGRSGNITVGYKPVDGKLRVVYLERFKSSKEKLLGERIVEIAKLFNVRSIVIDALPDFSTTQYVAKNLPNRIVLACEYSDNRQKQKIECPKTGKMIEKLSNTKVDLNANLVTAYRTGVLKDYLHLHNGNDVLYPNPIADQQAKTELDEVKLNLKNIKRIEKVDDKTGEHIERFVKLTKADHYAHAISYLNIACDVYKEQFMAITAAVAPPTIGSFKTQGKSHNAARVLNAMGATALR